MSAQLTHSHANKAVLDKFSESGGLPLFDGDAIGGGVGSVVQTVVAVTTTPAVVTASIPYDNTIPQQSEGTELMTVSITPQFASSKLLVAFDAWFTCDAVAGVVLAAFKDAVANALFARGLTASNGSSHAFLMSFRGYVDASVAGVAQTIKVRVGTAAGNLGFLGSPGGSGSFSTVNQAVLSVMEIKQ